MFGKSRMTISTILKPDNVAWFKKLAASGVRREAKRYMRSTHPDFQRLVFEAIGRGKKPATRPEVAQAAETIARTHGIRDFEASNNWCSRFIQQHDIPIRPAPRSKPDRPAPIAKAGLEAGFSTTHTQGTNFLSRCPQPGLPLRPLYELTQVLPLPSEHGLRRAAGLLHMLPCNAMSEGTASRSKGTTEGGAATVRVILLRVGSHVCTAWVWCAAHGAGSARER